ncbi:MAG: glycosyltransferase [Candidatus Delongbacteria bacterium]|nr:glycosyltransferase [Candidatus Delongbacteria bacterium]MDD4204505.1 glycosyltransferase [Candidatus Delongbacteria bacterium]
MKKVLIISYYFPPNAGAHVQRVTKFIKYLSCFGYEPVILTNKNKTERKDLNFLNDVINSRVYYAADFGKFIPGTLKKLFSKFFQPDKIINWRLTAVPQALKIIKEENIDLIFVSVPPHSMSSIASEISVKSKIPLVIDFRDEWITYPLFKEKEYSTINKRMYYEVISSCSALTTVNETLKRRIKTDLIKNRIHKKISPIFNGFDIMDLPNDIKKADSKKLKICYNGRFKKISDPKIFFRMLTGLIKSGSININEIEFICMDDKSNEKWLKDFPGLKEITTFTGYLPLKKSYDIINDCDIGLILLTNYGESSAFPLKMFDYLALDKPIIAFVDKEDELTDFLKKYKASEIFFTEDENFNDIRVIDFFKKTMNGDLKPNQELKKKFNRKKQTEKLAEVFNKVLDLTI